MHWVTRCHAYLRKNPGKALAKQEIEGFLHDLSKNHEEWQVNQAAEAIKLYRFYEKLKKTGHGRKTIESKAQWKAATDDMTKMLRLRHRSLRTEQAYLGWIRRFYNFLNGFPPYELDSSHVRIISKLVVVNEGKVQ